MNLSRSIHAVVFPSDGYYVANCLEVAVVTQGLTHGRDAFQLA